MRSLLFITLLPVLAHSQEPAALDSFVQKTITARKAAGASVLVAQKGKIILNKGYGFAHLGLDVKTKSETKYFAVGAGTIMLSAGILQLVDQGKLSLEDPIQKFLPDFPLQNKKVLVRHLITSTSGIPDYHYLGDPFAGLRYQPRTLDEVIALFAGEPFLMEPGEKFDWSISNFVLLTAIYEKAAGRSFEQFITKDLIGRFHLSGTVYMHPNQLIKDFAQGYQSNDGDPVPAYGSLFKYDPSLRIASTTADLHLFLIKLRENQIIKKNTYQLMTSREEALKNRSGTMGYGIRLVKEDSVEAIGVSGALEGYSSYMYYFPAADISVIVLSNSSEQTASAIGKDITRHLHGLSPLPARGEDRKPVDDIAIHDSDIQKVTGTYLVKRLHSPNSWATNSMYFRTTRIFHENGKMLLQRFGELPVQIYKQADGTYRFRSPEPVITIITEGDKKTITFKSPSITDQGNRIGDADAKTFRQSAFLNLR